METQCTILVWKTPWTEPPGGLQPMGSQESDTYIQIHTHIYIYICMLSHLSSVRLPGSPVQGILQARILEQVAMPSSRGSPRPRDQTHISYISYPGRRFFTTGATWQGQRGKLTSRERKRLIQGHHPGGVRAWTRAPDL